MNKNLRHDTTFLADSNLNALQKPNRSSHVLLWLCVCFIFTILFWAYYARLVEVTSGEGKVIPSRQIQLIQNLEGGIVREINVREGDVVQKDQVLMKIDDTRFAATYAEAATKSENLKITIARLTAAAEGTTFTLPKDIPEEQMMEYRHQKALYESQMNELKQLKDNYQLAKKEYQLVKPLLKMGAVSEVELMQLARTANDSKGRLIAFKSKILEELNKTKGELAGLKESNSAHKDRLKRTTVRSPVKGIIKKIHVTTIGGVVQPGVDMIEIVPLDDTLLIEANIKPADIGFLKPTQKAVVKISAYDYSIYGGLEGRLEQISADSIKDEKGNSFYLVRVRTKKNYLEKNNKKMFIIPGMVANVDLITGEKTVLDYILKPILKTKQNAMHER